MRQFFSCRPHSLFLRYGLDNMLSETLSRSFDVLEDRAFVTRKKCKLCSVRAERARNLLSSTSQARAGVLCTVGGQCFRLLLYRLHLFRWTTSVSTYLECVQQNWHDETIRTRVLRWKDGFRRSTFAVGGNMTTSQCGCFGGLGTLSSKCEKKIIQKRTFVQKHFHPTKHFRPKPFHAQNWKDNLHPRTLSSKNGRRSNDIFVQNQFHPMTVSSKTTFIPTLTLNPETLGP